MYTLVRVRLHGAKKFRWAGHVYDISSSGMRFELDGPVQPGTRIDARVILPGSQCATMTVCGHVVRYHDDADERGPMRMGMVFDTVAQSVDRRRLEQYLTCHGINQAA